MSLENKKVIYGNIEENENTKTPFETEIEETREVKISFFVDTTSGDKTSKSHKLEQGENKEKASKPPNFKIFKQSIEVVENYGYVSDFIFIKEYNEVLEGLNKNGTQTDLCSINGNLKKYVTCSFIFNELNVILVEVESKNSDFQRRFFLQKVKFLMNNFLKFYI